MTNSILTFSLFAVEIMKEDVDKHLIRSIFSLMRINYVSVSACAVERKYNILYYIINVEM